MARSKKFFKGKTTKEFSGLMIKSLIVSGLIAIAGLALIFYKDASNNIIAKVMGGMFVVTGLLSLYKYLKRVDAKLYKYNILFAIAFIVLGLIAMLVPFEIVSFINVIMGVYLIIYGAQKIVYGVWLKVGNHSSWLIIETIGIMLVLFGLLVVPNVFAKLGINQLVGTFLLLSSVLDITSLVLLNNNAEDISKIFW